VRMLILILCIECCWFLCSVCVVIYSRVRMMISERMMCVKRVSRFISCGWVASLILVW